MSDSDFLSGELLPTDLTIKRMPQATNASPGGALAVYPPDPDYDILPSATAEDYLPPFSRWATVGGVILLGGLGLVAGLSNFLKYKVTVQAPAAIRPVGELRVVQSTIEGSVLSISARENQVVNKGDLLATVKDLNLESKLQTKRSQLAGDIQTGIDQIAGIDAQILALARQGEGELEQSNRSIAGIQAELSRAGRDYQDKKTITRAQKIITSAQARLAKTKAALNPSPAESVQIQQKIERERANGTTIVARFQQDRQKLLQQRIEIINQIATNKQEIAQISTDLKPTPILAPISGTIQDLNLRNNRQVVRPGDRLAQIIPTGMPLTMKALVSVADIDKVNIGQKVQMRVSACPYTNRGLLSGKVTEVAADAKQIEKTTTDVPLQHDRASNANYEVTIEPDALALGNGATKCQIRSGMEGRAEIISKEETVFRFLLRKARLLINP